MRYLNVDLVLDCLTELSDYHLQDKLWTGKMPGLQSSFVEVVEGLFTDSGLEDELRKGTTGFSTELVAKLLEIDKRISKIPANCNDGEILNDPRMILIRELASNARLLLINESKQQPT